MIAISSRGTRMEFVRFGDIRDEAMAETGVTMQGIDLNETVLAMRGIQGDDFRLIRIIRADEIERRLRFR